MNFTFRDEMVGKMLEDMRKERIALAAYGPKSLCTSIMNSRRTPSSVVIAQVGQIDQREWDKWKGQP